MKIIVTTWLATFCLLFALACRVPETNAAQPIFVVSIHPLAAILRPLVGDRGKVVQLVPSDGSPHTFELKPSDLRLLDSARAVFFVDRRVLEVWLGGIEADRIIEVMDLLPEDLRLEFPTANRAKKAADASTDPHFWTDPLAVKAVIAPLADRLCDLDPEGCSVYRARASRFEAELDRINRQCETMLAGVKGSPVVLFHPSFQYFFKRYGLKVLGYIEPFPGREPTAREVLELVKRMKKAGVKALFTEPRMPMRPAEVVAESAGAAIHLLDPIGGGPGRESYAEMILANASVLQEAPR